MPGLRRDHRGAETVQIAAEAVHFQLQRAVQRQHQLHVAMLMGGAIAAVAAQAEGRGWGHARYASARAVAGEGRDWGLGIFRECTVCAAPLATKSHSATPRWVRLQPRQALSVKPVGAEAPPTVQSQPPSTCGTFRVPICGVPNPQSQVPNPGFLAPASARCLTNKTTLTLALQEAAAHAAILWEGLQSRRDSAERRGRCSGTRSAADALPSSRTSPSLEASHTHLVSRPGRRSRYRVGSRCG
ncbi:hypothetical protein NB689_002150 [Xanthomonas sacchari]|nr:hypothetical protein [Xanthomonas sacchari]